jgi:hypothetical protein
MHRGSYKRGEVHDLFSSSAVLLSTKSLSFPIPPGTFLVQGAMLCPLPSAKKNPRPAPFGFPGYIPRCEGFVPTDPGPDAPCILPL